MFKYVCSVHPELYIFAFQLHLQSIVLEPQFQLACILHQVLFCNIIYFKIIISMLFIYTAVGGTNYGHIIEGTVTSAVVVFIIVLAVYSKDRRKRGLPFIPQKLRNCCSGRITQPTPPSFDLQQHPYLRQVQSSPDSQFDTTYTQPCTSFSQFPETSFSQAPPPSYESQDSFPTKVDEDEPPPYEPPSGQPPAVFNTQNPTAHNVNV